MALHKDMNLKKKLTYIFDFLRLLKVYPSRVLSIDYLDIYQVP